MGVMTINCLDGKALRAAGFGHQQKREMLTTADREWILPKGPPKRALRSAPPHLQALPLGAETKYSNLIPRSLFEAYFGN